MNNTFKIILIFQTLLLSFNVVGNKIDSLKQNLKNATSDTSIINACLDLTTELEYSSPEEALKYCKKAVEIAYNINDSNYISQSLFVLATYYANNNEHLEAIKNFKIVAEIYKKLKNDFNRAVVLNNIGLRYYYLRNYNVALQYYIESLKIKEKLNDKISIAYTLRNIGNIYYHQHIFQDALDYYFKALKLLLEYNNIKECASIYNNIATIYDETKQDTLALKYYFQSLKIKKDYDDKKGMALTLNNIASVFVRNNNLNEANKYLNQSKDISILIGDEKQYATTIYYLGIVFDKNKNYSKAKNYLEESIKIGIKLDDKLLIASSYESISQVYYAINDLKNAYKFHLMFSSLKDSIYNSDTQSQISELKTIYETEKKEKEIELLNIDNKVKILELSEKSSKIEKQKLVIFFVVFGLLLVIVFSGFLLRLFIQKKKANKLLAQQKQQIEIQNSSLQQANEEITAQRDEIEAQNELVIKQKEHIENIHKDQTSSIKYAKTIQEAMLPDENIINEILSNYFILFMPRDIVSGDFYWFAKVKGKTIAIVADCTGHGVPGAFMSMLGIAFLNEIINKEQIISPDEILNKLRDNVIKSLKQHGQADQSNDGMDISIIVIKNQEPSLKNQVPSEEQTQLSNSLLEVNSKIYDVEFAGANNPAWLVRTNSDLPNFKNLENLIELKPDKMPIGIGYNMHKFSKQAITCNSGDLLYLMSDGYKDQINETDNKKFLSKNLKQLLLANSHLQMEEQKEIIKNTFDNWKGNTEQTDDVCIVGIKI